MWKRIENYIRDHREEIDRDEPGPEVWNNIQAAMNPQAKVKKITPWRYLEAAAMVLIALGAGLWWAIMNPDIPILKKQSGSLLDGTILIEENHRIPEMEMVEAYYTMQFSDRMQKIKTYDLNQFPAIEDYKKDLAQVDECIEALKKDIEKEGLHDQLIQAMRKNFEQKIAILDQLLSQLEKAEKANSTPPV
ncbi:MAG: hypothetical protein KDD63_18800 [Bacteroidetes bacterium]|nr:hypothetical protein [Bacteroidota bacterium]MCB0841834.1 hypothetical protein [Bacteroidota bacterium]MCB0854283.1 hypothetical protein [Bacteroidota bacterium]